MTLISAKVNHGIIGVPESKPFVVIETVWNSSGFAQIWWTDVTPKQLRELANELEEANNEKSVNG